MDLNALRRASMLAAEEAVISSIPKELLSKLEEAQKEFRASGGCKGCGSLVLAVHKLPCSELNENDIY